MPGGGSKYISIEIAPASMLHVQNTAIIRKISFMEMSLNT